MENTVVNREVIESVIGVDAPLEIIQKLSHETLFHVVDTIFWAFEENTDTMNYRDIHASSLTWLIEHHKEGKLWYKEGELWYNFWEIVEIVNRTILGIITVMQTQTQDF